MRDVRQIVGYGYNCFGHSGVDAYALDFYAPAGTPVTAASAGVAHRADFGTSGYGVHIWISHPGGFVSVYAHLREWVAPDNTWVVQGQTVGLADNTGTSDGDHLHFAVHSNATTQSDGNPYLPEPMSGVVGFSQWGSCAGGVSPNWYSTPPELDITVDRRPAGVGGGVLDLYTRGDDGRAWHAWFDGFSYSAWEALGGGVKAAPVGSWATSHGGPDVFAVGMDDRIWRTSYNSACSCWSGFVQLSSGMSGSGETEAVTASRRADQSVDLFVRGGDGAAWHAWGDTAGNPIRGWESLGGGVKGAPVGSWRTSPEGMDVFAIGSLDDLVYKNSMLSGTWGGWVSVSPAGRSGSSEREQVGVDRRPDGSMDLYVRGPDAAQNAWWVTASALGNPSGLWQNIGGSVLGAPNASWNDLLSRLEAFVIGPDDLVWTTTYGLSWASWTQGSVVGLGTTGHAG